MSRTLLVRPRPKPGQSAECYVQHLAEQNGYTSGESMLKRIVGISGAVADTISLKQLEILTGNDPQALAAAQLTLIEERGVRQFRFHNLMLPTYHLRREKWICPCCYEESGYMNASWRIVWLPVCTKHECALEPYEVEGSGHQGPEVLDLFLSQSAADQSAPADVLEVQSWLEKKLFADAISSSRDETDLVSLIDTYLVRALRLRRCLSR